MSKDRVSRPARSKHASDVTPKGAVVIEEQELDAVSGGATGQHFKKATLT